MSKAAPKAKAKPTGIGRKYYYEPVKARNYSKAKSYSQKNQLRKAKKDMNTTSSIYKQDKPDKPEEKKPEHKPEHKKPVSIFKEEGVERATTSPDPVSDNPATAGYLTPAQAAEKEARDTQPAQGSVSAPVVGATTQKAKEDKEDKILRVLKAARVRLQGRGMPELDIEVDELIAELDKGGKK